MVIFRLDAGPSVYHAFIMFDAAFSTTPVETKILALDRLDACTAFVIEILRGEGFCGVQLPKNYSITYENFLRLATTQLVRAVRQVSEYEHSEELKVDTKNNSVDFWKKTLSRHVS